MPMYSRTVTMCKARYLRNHIAQEQGYNVDFRFDYNADEVQATFSCSDDYADPRLCHNDEDLFEYIIRRYGAFLTSDNVSTPKNFSLSMKKIGEVLTNPKLQQRDNYQDEYPQALTKEEWLRLRLDMPEVRCEGRKLNSSYEPEKYLIRLGLWQGHG